MTDATPHPRRNQAAALVAGALAAVVLATGFVAIAFASGKSPKPRPPAVTGSIHLKHGDVFSGRAVRGEVVFENHTSQTKVLMRGCTIDGLYAIGFRASDGYVQEPAFSLVGCSPEQEMVAKPGTTIYRFKVPATSCRRSRPASTPRCSSRTGSGTART
jgi:hypothetical protein